MMFKKFTDGLFFGSGFAISFVVIWFAASYIAVPLFATSYTTRVSGDELARRDPPKIDSPVSEGKNLEYSAPVRFHELEIEQQIAKASVIALAEYVQSDDGKMKAIITEIVKNKPGTTMYYEVGDEYSSSSYYPKGNTRYGNRLVIFFTGSPAQMALSMSYSGDRISGLGDMPLKLFREKCAETNA